MKTFAFVIFLIIKVFIGSDYRPDNIPVSPQFTVTLTNTDPLHHQSIVHTLDCGYAEESSEDKEGSKNTADRHVPSVINLYTVIVNLFPYSPDSDSFFRSAPYHILYSNLRL